MPHSVSHIYVHLIFATKKRQPWISEKYRHFLEAYVAKVYANSGHVLIAQFAMPDHYHGLFRFNINRLLPDFVKVLKSSSTHMLNQDYLSGSFEWQSGYGIFSHTSGDLTRVIHYIRNQPAHHAKHSFIQEVELLNRKYKGDWIVED